MVSPWKKTLPVIILTENLRFSFYVHGVNHLWIPLIIEFGGHGD